MLWPVQLTRATQAAVYAVADAFGFQQFNYSPTAKEWAAATAGLAGDQLVAVLRDAALRRAAADARDDHAAAWPDALGAAVQHWKDALGEVHAEYFEQYELWRTSLGLPHPEEQRAANQPPPAGKQRQRQRQLQQLQQPSQQRAARERAAQQERDHSQPVVQLHELGLWGLVYCEAANLRHTPHLLCLIYYILRGSTLFTQVVRAATPDVAQGAPLPHGHWRFWLGRSADDFPSACCSPPRPADGGGASGGAAPAGCDLTVLRRSLVEQLAASVPQAFCFSEAPAAANVEAALDAARAQEAALQRTADTAAARLASAGQGAHAPLVASVLARMRHPTWLRDQHTFLNRVVQPLFSFLAEQIDLAGQQAGEEAALRIAYCDVDERCCSPRAVRRLLAELAACYGSPAKPEDLWRALLEVMAPAQVLQGPAWQPVTAVEAASAANGKAQAGARARKHRFLFWRPASQQPLAEEATARYPRDAQRVAVLANLALLLQRSSANRAASMKIKAGQEEALRNVTAKTFAPLAYEPEAVGVVYAVAKRGADWWATHLLRRKTFVEARSLAAPFVAFWRVFSFHACLITAMAAVAFMWRLKEPGSKGWLQLVAGLSLATVTDSLMRVARAAAHLLLLSYRVPVVRKQAGSSVRVRLDPFPAGTLLAVMRRLLSLAVWLVWSAALVVAIVPVLTDQPLVPGLSRLLTARALWLVLPLAHAVLVWGAALACQRRGYTTSLAGLLADLRRRRPAAAGGGGSLTAAHADCAADGAIDALFFPARNLRVAGRRSALNAALWAAVIAAKVVFEYALLIWPLTGLVLVLLQAQKDSYLERALGVHDPAPLVHAVLAALSHATAVAGVAVPVVLLCFCDTGLFFSLLGSVWSTAVGFRRGVGSFKSWSHLVSRFTLLLQTYKEHCVSRSALALHLHGSDPSDMQELCMSALAAGWNALVLDLRTRDLLSTRELACLTFEALQLTEDQKRSLRTLGHVRKLELTTVLPARCFMAGAIPELAAGAVASEHQLWVARTAWGWMLWLTWQCDLINAKEMEGLSALKLLHPPRSHEQSRRWQEMLAEALALLQLLSKSKAQPSNTAAAAAALLAAASQASSFAAGAASGGTAAGAAAASGLLHKQQGAPSQQQLEAWRDLSGCMSRLLRLLDEEVRQLEDVVRQRSPHGSGAAGACADAFAACLFGARAADVTAPELQGVRAALDSLLARWAPFARAAEAAAPKHPQRMGTRARALTKVERADRDQVLARIAAVGAASSSMAQICGWLVDVLTLLAGDTLPADGEAVSFMLSFAASLTDPGLGTAPSLQAMPSLTTLVPHYDEDVIYALSEDDALADLASLPDPPRPGGALQSRDKLATLLTPDGAAAPTLSYLRSVYDAPGAGATQWANFSERVLALADARGLNVRQLRTVNEFCFLRGEPLHPLKSELLLWASWRGQLLARTVRGLMSYRAALAALAAFENPHLPDLPGAAGAPPPPPAGQGGTGGTAGAALRAALLEDLLDCKHGLVVSSQILGVHAARTGSDLKSAWLVHALGLLRAAHPALRVAYVDAQLLVRARRLGNTVDLSRQASVLLASERARGLGAAAGVAVGREAYRVLLPINFESNRGVILGEGKPENQNHAVIFCHGEALQTIDSNQDCVLAEGLKLPNLLSELLPDGWDTPGGGGAAANRALLAKPPRERSRVALVGFREWIFSQDSGAQADFAAATERSFGTTVQRLMHNPGACRFHYGHPDVWRRSFVATCGGVSKANKGLHVSEDVFGGYNVMLRGRDIRYVDYIAVGKGRDMGFETINTFEAKIAAGNGEQVLSRDVRRLGHNMDFARLLSWYHTGNGFFINTALTMLSIHAALWAFLLLYFDTRTGPAGAAVQAYLSAVQLLQLGSLSVVTYWLTLALEAGLFRSAWVLARQLLQGSAMFFVFRAQTSASSFVGNLMFGGAKYIATGRGYKLAATSFRDLYRRFGRSHYYFGAVLLQYCLAAIAAGHLSGAKLLVLWAPFLVVVALLVGPFWFTPFAFKTENVMADFEAIGAWLASPSLKPEHAWQAWNAESWAPAANASGKQMGRVAASLAAHAVKLPSLLLLLAAISRFHTRADSRLPSWGIALVLAAGTLLLVGVILASRRWSARRALESGAPRVLTVGATVLLAGGLAVSGFATSGDAGRLGNAALVLFGTVLLLRLLPLVRYNPALAWRGVIAVADAVYFGADAALLLGLNGLRFVLSMFGLLTGLQAQLLFNSAYARQVMADASLEYSRVPQLITDALRLKREWRSQQLATAAHA